MGSRRPATIVVVALAAALTNVLVGGCAQSPDGPALVLTLASPDEITDDNADHVTRFAEEVDRLSEGSIRIDPVWDAEQDGRSGWDQALATTIADGTYDLGLVPGRAWDELGVNSLRALDAPFLIDSTALLEDVLNRAGLREELLSGLLGAGVVGLDLFPSRLRHPVGFAEPLLGPEDYRGQTIRAPRSATTRLVLEALGAARVVDDSPNNVTQRGMETSYGIGGGTGIATGNVVLFSKTESLVADTDVRDRLREDQWELLGQAASNTRGWLTTNLPSEAEAAAEFCGHGGRIVTATTGQVVQLQRAAAPVTKWLREDARTRQLLDRIEAIARTHPAPEIVEECPSDEKQHEDDPELHAIDGVYTATVTIQQLLAAGSADPERNQESAGIYRWTLDGGVWTYAQRAKHFVANPADAGTYTYTDGLFTMNWPGGGVTTARLRIVRDGSLHFRDIKDADPTTQAEAEGFFASPWRRVDDLKE